jgi:hypothetical protein
MIDYAGAKEEAFKATEKIGQTRRPALQVRRTTRILHRTKNDKNTPSNI